MCRVCGRNQGKLPQLPHQKGKFAHLDQPRLKKKKSCMITYFILCPIRRKIIMNKKKPGMVSNGKRTIYGLTETKRLLSS